jgi:hypothetical protein
MYRLKPVLMKRVYILYFVSAKWRRRSECLPPPGVSTLRGRDDQNASLATEAYNVEENKWEILPPMSQQLGSCHVVFLRENFIVVRNMEIM